MLLLHHGGGVTSDYELMFRKVMSLGILMNRIIVAGVVWCGVVCEHGLKIVLHKAKKRIFHIPRDPMLVPAF